jgi:hypothetical protein
MLAQFINATHDPVLRQMLYGNDLASRSGPLPCRASGLEPVTKGGRRLVAFRSKSSLEWRWLHRIVYVEMVVALDVQRLACPIA